MGLLISSMVAGLAFFFARFINRYDEFERRTINRENETSLAIYTLSASVVNLQTQVKESGFDSKAKGHITTLSNRVNKLDTKLEEKLEPWVEATKENHGKILSLDTKLVAMFKTVQILVNQTEKKRQG